MTDEMINPTSDPKDQTIAALEAERQKQDEALQILREDLRRQMAEGRNQAKMIVDLRYEALKLNEEIFRLKKECIEAADQARAIQAAYQEKLDAAEEKATRLETDFIIERREAEEKLSLAEAALDLEKKKRKEEVCILQDARDEAEERFAKMRMRLDEARVEIAGLRISYTTFLVQKSEDLMSRAGLWKNSDPRWAVGDSLFIHNIEALIERALENQHKKKPEEASPKVISTAEVAMRADIEYEVNAAGEIFMHNPKIISFDLVARPPAQKESGEGKE